MFYNSKFHFSPQDYPNRLITLKLECMIFVFTPSNTEAWSQKLFYSHVLLPLFLTATLHQCWYYW